jgi:integrase
VPRFVEDAKAGRALNKKGKKYKPNAIVTIEQALGLHVVPSLGARRLVDIRKGDIQRIADNVSEKRSGSRVRGVVNSVRSLYTWANQRELASHDPAADIVLPPVNAKPRERIATPKEMVALLGALERKDAVPYALAAYSWARRAQIERLRWEEVDLKVGLVEWGADEENARKSEAANTSCRCFARCGRCYEKHGSNRAGPPAISSCVHRSTRQRAGSCRWTAWRTAQSRHGRRRSRS